MTDIVTITPNPAVDISTEVEKIVPVHKLRGAWRRSDPGGGGINVARVIKRLGGEALAIFPIGGATGESLRKLVEREGVTSSTFAIEDETREDFFVSEAATGQQYRFILPGPLLREGEWQECLNLLSRTEPFPRFVVASGSLPQGVPDDFYARVARLVKERGARMILDTSGPALAAAVAEGVDLIKPNLRPRTSFETGESPSLPSPWGISARYWWRETGSCGRCRPPSRRAAQWAPATVFWARWSMGSRRGLTSTARSGSLPPQALRPFSIRAPNSAVPRMSDASPKR
jgi:6-phosphofructokinase 2